jgi:hypothetical protein
MITTDKSGITLQFASFKAKIQMDEVLFFINYREACGLWHAACGTLRLE